MQIPGRWDKEKFEKDHEIRGTRGLITAAYIVLNEADYIWASLSSIYSSVDKIIIVEGATQYAVKDAVSPLGLSTDGTPQLIQAFQDTLDLQGKIKWVRAGWAKNKTELRNRGFEHVPEGTTFLLRMDGDELMRAEEIKLAIDIMLQDPHSLVAEARHFMFWGSTHRLLELIPDPEYVGMLFRYIPGMYCAGHEDLFVSPNCRFYDDPSRVIHSEGFNLYHYGWVKDKRKLVFKRWERLRQMQAESQHVSSLQYLAEKDDYGLYLEAISHCKALNLANVDAAHESVMPFLGVHPEMMLKHPFFGQKPQFFGMDY